MKMYLPGLIAVLAARHGVPERRILWLRSIVKNLCVIGLAMPSAPARGAFIDFKPADIAKIALAIELRRAGLSREATVNTVTACWPDLVEQAFAGRADGRRVRYLGGEINILTGEAAVLRPLVGDELGTFAASRPRNLFLIECTRFFERLVEAFWAAGMDATGFIADLDEAQPRILANGARVACDAGGADAVVAAA